MACTIAVARRGQQRSLLSSRRVLRVAMAFAERADAGVGPVHRLFWRESRCRRRLRVNVVQILPPALSRPPLGCRS
jgi:hypothetical protein